MRERRGQTGSATLLVVAMAGVLLLLGAGLAVVTALVAAQSGARGVASGGDGCAIAREVAAANGARLTLCAVSGRVVDVEVQVPGPHWLGQAADLAGRSRAGPAP